MFSGGEIRFASGQRIAIAQGHSFELLGEVREVREEGPDQLVRVQWGRGNKARQEWVSSQELAGKLLSQKRNYWKLFEPEKNGWGETRDVVVPTVAAPTPEQLLAAIEKAQDQLETLLDPQKRNVAQLTEQLKTLREMRAALQKDFKTWLQTSREEAKDRLSTAYLGYYYAVTQGDFFHDRVYVDEEEHRTRQAELQVIDQKIAFYERALREKMVLTFNDLFSLEFDFLKRAQALESESGVLQTYATIQSLYLKQNPIVARSTFLQRINQMIGKGVLATPLPMVVTSQDLTAIHKDIENYNRLVGETANGFGYIDVREVAREIKRLMALEARQPAVQKMARAQAIVHPLVEKLRKNPDFRVARGVGEVGLGIVKGAAEMIDDPGLAIMLVAGVGVAGPLSRSLIARLLAAGVSERRARLMGLAFNGMLFHTANSAINLGLDQLPGADRSTHVDFSPEGNLHAIAMMAWLGKMQKIYGEGVQGYLKFLKDRPVLQKTLDMIGGKTFVVIGLASFNLGIGTATHGLEALAPDNIYRELLDSARFTIAYGVMHAGQHGGAKSPGREAFELARRNLSVEIKRQAASGKSNPARIEELTAIVKKAFEAFQNEVKQGHEQGLRLGKLEPQQVQKLLRRQQRVIQAGIKGLTSVKPADPASANSYDLIIRLLNDQLEVLEALRKQLDPAQRGIEEMERRAEGLKPDERPKRIFTGAAARKPMPPKPKVRKPARVQSEPFQVSVEPPKFTGYLMSHATLPADQLGRLMSVAEADVARTLYPAQSEKLHINLVDLIDLKKLQGRLIAEATAGGETISKGEAQKRARAIIEQAFQSLQGRPMVTGIGKVTHAEKGYDTYFAAVEWLEVQAIRRAVGLPEKDLHITLASTEPLTQIGYPPDVQGVQKKPNVRVFGGESGRGAGELTWDVVALTRRFEAIDPDLKGRRSLAFAGIPPAEKMTEEIFLQLLEMELTATANAVRNEAARGGLEKPNWTKVSEATLHRAQEVWAILQTALREGKNVWEGKPAVEAEYEFIQACLKARVVPPAVTPTTRDPEAGMADPLYWFNMLWEGAKRLWSVGRAPDLAVKARQLSSPEAIVAFFERDVVLQKTGDPNTREYGWVIEYDSEGREIKQFVVVGDARSVPDVSSRNVFYVAHNHPTTVPLKSGGLLKYVGRSLSPAQRDFYSFANDVLGYLDRVNRPLAEIPESPFYHDGKFYHRIYGEEGISIMEIDARRRAEKQSFLKFYFSIRPGSTGDVKLLREVIKKVQGASDQCIIEVPWEARSQHPAFAMPRIPPAEVVVVRNPQQARDSNEAGSGGWMVDFGEWVVDAARQVFGRGPQVVTDADVIQIKEDRYRVLTKEGTKGSITINGEPREVSFAPATSVTQGAVGEPVYTMTIRIRGVEDAENIFWALIQSNSRLRPPRDKNSTDLVLDRARGHFSLRGEIDAYTTKSGDGLMVRFHPGREEPYLAEYLLRGLIKLNLTLNPTEQREKPKEMRHPERGMAEIPIPKWVDRLFRGVRNLFGSSPKQSAPASSVREPLRDQRNTIWTAPY